MFAAYRPTGGILRVEVTDTLAFWTVLAGPTLRVVDDVDGFLCHLRFGRTRAESTTKAYARSRTAPIHPHGAVPAPRRSRAHALGERPYDSSTIGYWLQTWLDQFAVTDEHGKPFDLARVFPYAFRHTYAQL